MAVPHPFSIHPPVGSKFTALEKGLIIFIKNPELGRIKTRLAKDLGVENALKIYMQLLAHTRKVSSEVPCNRLLFYDQQVTLKDEWPEKQYYKFVQKGNDLGERMFHAFQKAFSLGNKQVAIIGSDCADLTSSLIKEAFKQLKQHDFVLGPAKDGGYYLLAMKKIHPSLFQNKNWSTDTVAEETLGDIKNLGKTYYLLPQLTDVDTAADLNDELKALIW